MYMCVCVRVCPSAGVCCLCPYAYSSRDGMTGADFHRLCDNQGGTLTLLQGQGNGFLFCGYWSGTWTGPARGTIKSDGVAGCNALG